MVLVGQGGRLIMFNCLFLFYASPLFYLFLICSRVNAVTDFLCCLVYVRGCYYRVPRNVGCATFRIYLFCPIKTTLLVLLIVKARVMGVLFSVCYERLSYRGYPAINACYCSKWGVGEVFSQYRSRVR